MSEWILDTIIDWGYVGIFVLMVLENVFPPIPSELIMPFAGFAAARGDLDPAGVLAAGVAGSLLGTSPPSPRRTSTTRSAGSSASAASPCSSAG